MSKLGMSSRGYAEKWSFVRVNKDEAVVVRLSNWDVPKMFGGSLEKKEDKLEEGYELRPRFWCCGCMYFVIEGENTATSCWACELGTVNHKPCGVVKMDYLEKYYDNDKNYISLSEFLEGKKNGVEERRRGKWVKEI